MMRLTSTLLLCQATLLLTVAIASIATATQVEVEEKRMIDLIKNIEDLLIEDRKSDVVEDDKDVNVDLKEKTSAHDLEKHEQEVETYVDLRETLDKLDENADQTDDNAAEAVETSHLENVIEKDVASSSDSDSDKSDDDESDDDDSDDDDIVVKDINLDLDEDDEMENDGETFQERRKGSSNQSKKKKKGGKSKSSARFRKLLQKELRKAWNYAKDKLEKDKKLKHKYYTKNVDKIFKKADTCEACLQLMHPPPGKNNMNVFKHYIKEEEKDQMYLFMKQYLQKLFKGYLKGKRWVNVFELDAFQQAWKRFIKKSDIFNGQPKPKPCIRYRYRSIDGSCNNLDHRTWGQALTAQRRFFGATYDDGFQEPRQTDSSGLPLPSARKITNIISENKPNLDTVDDPINTVAVPAFGQFLDHDITLTPISTGESGSTIKCCDIKEDREQCFNIKIPPDDKRFQPNGCMEFVRSTPFIEDRSRSTCVRQVLNGITAFVDASNVYGSDVKKAKELREKDSAYLKEVKPGRHLPRAPDSECNITVPKYFCKLGGDERANEIATLTMLHTAFVRLHNNIVGVLESFKWKGETLFLETRKIVGGIMQHITYTEFLPIILDERIISKYNLGKDAYKYNRYSDPSIRVEFSTAAFRFGHSLVQTNQACLRGRNQFLINEPLKSQFFNPRISQACPGGVAQWMSSSICKRMDRSFVTGLKNNLFLDASGGAFDLPGLNIQRGRDHGIPSYTAVRCAFFKDHRCPKSFRDLKRNMDDKTIKRLQKAYKKVEDIDLFVGGVSETPYRKGLVGETFAELIGCQFDLLKKGDRFWYETKTRDIRFTPSQLKVIKRVKLRHVLCDVFADLKSLPENVFRKSRKRLRCSKWATEKTLKPWRKW